jgi:hypothetical protein
MLDGEQFELASKSQRKALQGRLSRVSGAALDAADVGLRNLLPAEQRHGSRVAGLGPEGLVQVLG